MSDRRAAIRRERAERKKAEKHKAPISRLERADLRGTADGKTLAISIVFSVLKEKYGFGKKKLLRICDLISKESLKYRQAATAFNIEFYRGRMLDKIGKIDLKISPERLEEAVYVAQRDETFVVSCAIIFIVLNQEFNFSSNSKGTGRTDLIMEYATNEFIKFNLDKTRDAVWYYERFKKITGIDLEADSNE